MKEFKEKLEAVLNAIEKDESSLEFSYKLYDNRSKALSIFDEVSLDEDEKNLLFNILANTPADGKIALVIAKEDDENEPNVFAFPEYAVDDMYNSIEVEVEKEDWELALEKEDFGISEIATIKIEELDEVHGFVLDILHDSHDILNFVEYIKNSDKVKNIVATEISKGLSSLLRVDAFEQPIVVYVSSDNTTAFVGDENLKALKSYILDEIFHEEPHKGVVEYEDGWGYDYDVEEEDIEDYEYDDNDEEDYGVVAPFLL